MTGLMEIYNHGTNRGIAMCREAGIAPPTFEESTGAAVVTFKVNVLGPGSETARVGSKLQPESQPESRLESRLESRPKSGTSPVPVQFQSLKIRILAILRGGAAPASILSKHLGQKRVSGQLKVVLNRLLTDSLIESTIPDKPNSRLQKYRLTEKGRQVLIIKPEKDERTDNG
ncbi:MAG: Fic family protein [Candidatus Geothermincolia bacterium]